MAKRDPRLQLRGSRWCVRVKVPDALRAAGLIKRREFTKSLGTSDFAEARRLLPLELVKIDAEIAAARRRLSGKAVRTLSRSEMEHLAVQLFHRREAKRLRAAPAGPDALTHEEADNDVADWLEALRDPSDDEARNVVGNAAKHLLAEHGVDLDTASPEWREFAGLIRRVYLEEARRSLREHRSDHSATLGDALFEGIEGMRPIPAAAVTATLSETLKRWRSTPEQKALSPKSKLKALAQDRLFLEILGETTAVAAITRADTARLVDVLAHLPANASKRWPKASAEEAANLAEAAGLAPMARLTAKSYLTALHTFFQFVVARGLRENNPAAGLSAGSDKIAAKDRRYPFSSDQLQKIFAAPIYTGCVDDARGYAVPGPNRPRRARFWVPILSLLHGLRLGEACQLHTSDIATLDGVPVILIRTTDDDGEETDKRIKTASGERFVPIHPEAITMGFLAYVEAMRRTKQVRLFPELKASEATGYLSDPFSKWFSRFLERVGAKRGKTSFHSFRHSYRDALREADISTERVRALGGWTSGNTEDNYGSGLKASTLAADMAKLRFPVDLKHLHVAPAKPPAT